MTQIRHSRAAIWTSRKPPFSLWRRATCVFLLVAGMSRMGDVATAEELRPLREDKQALSSLLSTFEVAQGPAYYPALSIAAKFKVIRPKVLGVESLARYGLVELPADNATLSDLVRRTIEARLSELGTSTQIRVEPPPLDLTDRDIDCDLLRVSFEFHGNESEPGSRSAIVVVQLIAWQNAIVRQPDGTLECLDKRYSPVMRLDSTKVFVAKFGDRVTALARSREALISMVDQAILLRIIASNRSALQAVQALVGEP